MTTEPPEMPAPPSVDDIIAANELSTVRTTDTGNAKWFVKLFRDVVRYVPETDTWYTWMGIHWEIDTRRLRTYALTEQVIRKLEDEALRLPDEAPGGGRSPREIMLGHVVKTEADGPRRRMLDIAQSDPRITTRFDELDVGFDVLTTPSGCVDLLTGEETSCRPELLSTARTLVPYDPGAKSGELDRYLDTFLPDPLDQAVVFAVLGSALRGGNSARIFPIFLGGTTSGKSQLIAAVANVLRGYATAVNASVFRGNLDDRPRPDLVKAMMTRLAYATEASQTWELHADQVKRLTGGDKILYRNLYGKAIESTPRFTPLIITNEMPRVKHADQAFKRRMIVVRFEHSLDPRLEDTAVRDRFVRDEDCQRALLARMIEGARSPLLVHGLRWDLMPEKFAEETLRGFDELDHVGEFVAWMVESGHLERVEQDGSVPGSHYVKASDLHAWYTYWVRKHGSMRDRQDVLSLREFGQRLREKGWAGQKIAGTRWLGWVLKVPVSEWL